MTPNGNGCLTSKTKAAASAGANSQPFYSGLSIHVDLRHRANTGISRQVYRRPGFKHTQREAAGGHSTLLPSLPVRTSRLRWLLILGHNQDRSYQRKLSANRICKLIEALGYTREIKDLNLDIISPDQTRVDGVIQSDDYLSDDGDLSSDGDSNNHGVE